MSEYGRLIDQFDHYGQNINEEEGPTHYQHTISDHTTIPDLYITTEYRETWGKVSTRVNKTEGNRIGEARIDSHRQTIDAPPELNGQDHEALRAYHQRIVDDYTAQPPRRAYTPDA